MSKFSLTSECKIGRFLGVGHEIPHISVENCQLSPEIPDAHVYLSLLGITICKVMF